MRKEKRLRHSTVFILLKLSKLLGLHVSIKSGHLQTPVDSLFLSTAELH